MIGGLERKLAGTRALLPTALAEWIRIHHAEPMQLLGLVQTQPLQWLSLFARDRERIIELIRQDEISSPVRRAAFHANGGEPRFQSKPGRQPQCRESIASAARNTPNWALEKQNRPDWPGRPTRPTAPAKWPIDAEKARAALCVFCIRRSTGCIRLCGCARQSPRAW